MEISPDFNQQKRGAQQTQAQVPIPWNSKWSTKTESYNAMINDNHDFYIVMKWEDFWWTNWVRAFWCFNRDHVPQNHSKKQRPEFSSPVVLPQNTHLRISNSSQHYIHFTLLPKGFSVPLYNSLTQKTHTSFAGHVSGDRPDFVNRVAANFEPSSLCPPAKKRGFETGAKWDGFSHCRLPLSNGSSQLVSGLD